MEQELVTPKSVRETYDSLNEFAATSRRRGKRQRRSGDRRASDFNGYTSYADAIEFAERGWTGESEVALNVADQAIARLVADRMIPTPTATWEVSGAEVDVARFLGNEPECMLEFPPTAQLRRGDTVTIVRKFSVSCMVNAEDIKKYGRLVASLVLAIERMGLSAEVWADACIWPYAVNYDRGNRLYQRVKIKGAADMMHPGQLMFGLAHPAMLRQVAFGSWDDDLPEDIYAGLAPNVGRGRPVDRNDAEEALYPEGTLFLDAPKWNEDPIVFLVQQFQKLGLVPEA